MNKVDWFKLLRSALSTLLLIATMGSGPAQLACASTNQSPISTGARNQNKDWLRQAHSEKRTKKPRETNSLRLSSPPTDLEIFASHIFFEPLIPTTATPDGKENTALVAALLEYASHKNIEDFSALARFIRLHPNSRWRAALESNWASALFDAGYLSQALNHWSSAWQLTKNFKDTKRAALADAALSNLLMLEARIGRKDALDKQFVEIEHRSFNGSAAKLVNDAKNGLWTMHHHSQIAFLCGPHAINNLAGALGRKTHAKEFKKIENAVSTAQGTNMAQLQDMAAKAGLKLAVAKRTPGSAIVTPSIMHWSVGHFACIVSEEEGRYKLQDPTFDSHRHFWLSKRAIEAESDGYFLLPAGKLPEGWRYVSRTEAAKVWGKGMASDRYEGQSPYYDPLQLLTMSCGRGMPSPSALSIYASLVLQDIPVGYTPAVGPDMAMSLSYIDGQLNQPATFTFTNLGYNWNFNWLSYLTVQGRDVSVRVRGGGTETFNYQNQAAPYAPNWTSQATLTQQPAGSFERQLPDGSIETFEKLAPTDTYYFMTKVTDPQGNEADITFSNYRITQIQDASGNAPVTVAYVSNTPGDPGYYKIASITDGFSRAASASFSYDSSTTSYLTSTTDAVGNVSNYTYSPGTSDASFIRMMNTPYGTTSFYSYIPSGTFTYPPAGMRTMYPDGTTSVIENWLDQQHHTYYWDRHATSLYPNDPANHVYSHCKTTRFYWAQDLNGVTVEAELPIINWIRPALESPIVFNYQNQGNFDRGDGITSNKPTQVLRQTTGYRETLTITYNTGHSAPVVGDYVGFSLGDDLLPGPTPSQRDLAYVVQSTDTTLADVAVGLANVVNNDSIMQAFGVSAVASGDAVIVTSRSPFNNKTPWLQYWPAGHTPVGETVTDTHGPNVGQNTQINTVQPADFITLTFIDSGLSGGSEALVYTIQPNDTPVTVAQQLALLINTDPGLHSIQVSATWNGPAATAGAVSNPEVCVYSNSPNATSYSSNSSSPGTTQISDHVNTAGLVQEWNFVWNQLGHCTQATDPVGRQFNLSYAANNIDLLAVTENLALGDNFTLGSWQYTNPSAQHCPTIYTDSSGKQTSFTYTTAFSQPATITDANNSTTTLSYDSGGYLTQIQGPLAGSADITSFSFYGYGPPHTITNSQGYTLTYSFDNLNRPTGVIYPDSTQDTIAYDRLDAVFSTDRLGRCTRDKFDSLDQISSETDPLGRTTKYCWCTCGALRCLTDAANQITSWNHDVEGRTISKTMADGTTSVARYDNIGRIASQTDALGQITNYLYNYDDSPSACFYSNVLQPASTKSFVFDTIYPRLTAAKNGWGSLNYSYNPYMLNSAMVASGAPSTGDYVNVTIYNAGVSTVGIKNEQYLVTSSDTTLAQMLTHIASQITTDNVGVGISASSDGNVLTITPSNSSGPASLQCSANGTVTFTVGGTGNPNDRINVIVNNATSSGSTNVASYQPTSGELPASMATNLAAAINGVSGNQHATVSGSVVTVTTTAPRAVNYSSNIGSASTTPNETIAQAGGASEQLLAAPPTGLYVSGTPASGDSVSITITNPAISGGSYAYSHSITGADTDAPTLAKNMAAQITTALSGDHISAGSAGNMLLITPANSSGAVTVTSSTTGSGGNQPNETVTAGGGGQLQVGSSSIPNSDCTYAFDALGRTVNRLIHGSANNTAWSYDAISRVTSEKNNLGSTAFSFAYVDDASGSSKGDPRLASVTYPNSQTTTFSYLPTILDERLQQIKNLNPSSGVLSQFNYAFDAVGQIRQWQQQQNSTNVHQSLGYDMAGQLTSALTDSGSTFNAYISGTVHNPDLISITAYDASLTGTTIPGQETAQYTVLSTDTPGTIAQALAGQINSNMSNIGVTASWSSNGIITINTSPSYCTSFTCGVSGTGATDTITLSGSSPITNPHLYKQLFYGYDCAGNRIGVQGDSSGSFPTGLTTSSMASSYNNVNELTSTAAGGPIAFQATTTNPVKSAVLNASQIATIGGTTITTGDTVTLSVHDKALSQAENVTYPVASTDHSTGDVAVGLKSAINADAALSGLVSASASGSVVTVNSTSTNPTYFSASTSSGATETITLSPSRSTSASISPTTAFAGSPTLAAGSNTVSVTAVSGGGTSATLPCPITISSASGSAFSFDLNGNMTSDGSSYCLPLSDMVGTVTRNVDSERSSVGPAKKVDVQKSDLTRRELRSKETQATSQDKPYMTISGLSTEKTALSSDSGSGCTNTLLWDAENRLIQITYPGSGNNSQFQYDALGRCVKIIEVSGGSTTSTKQFVWCGSERCEVRDGSGSLTNQYFALGQVNVSGGTPTSYFYSKDHLGSVREMTDSSGTIVWQQAFDPYGQPATPIVSTTPPDFRYAGMYWHDPSQLNLTWFRQYNSGLGRWLSRDPLGFGSLYGYAGNDPVGRIDPLGLYYAVSQFGNNVIITVPMKYTGEGANRGDSYNQAISETWSGTFGQYHVQTIARPPVQGEPYNTVDIPTWGTRLETPPGGDTGTWPIWAADWFTRPGQGWPGAHEAGHFFGLEDQSTGPGIMNQNNAWFDPEHAKPTAQNIQDILNNKNLVPTSGGSCAPR